MFDVSKIIISSAFHEREVDLLGDGTKEILHFKELPAQRFVVFNRQCSSRDDDVYAGAAALLVADSLVNPDGSVALTRDQALKIKTVPLNALLAAVMEVHGKGADGGAGKSSPSAAKSGSGTS